MARSLHCVVSGRVQGVFFRAYVVDQAETLGLAGWVRNLPGGRVEALAQGEGAALAAFEEKLRQGSPLAEVDAVDVQWKEDEPVFKNFQIKR